MRPNRRRHEDPRASDGLERGLVFAATLVGLVTGVVALVEIRWWVSALCLITVGVAVTLWVRANRMSAPMVGAAVAAGIVGTLAINGVVAAWPSRVYSGDFMVVGNTVQVAHRGPSANSPEDRDQIYTEGDIVTVVCRERDWKHPTRYWFRLRHADSFVQATALVPALANPPDTPPDC